MDIYWVDDSGLHQRGIEDMAPTPGQTDGFIWVDVPSMDDEAERLFRDVFGFAEETIVEAKKFSLVPKLKIYDDHVTLTVHSIDSQGHLLELDEIIGQNFLVTVHQAAAGVAEEEVVREAAFVRSQIERDGYRPSSPAKLAVALIDEIASWLEKYLEDIAFRAGALDRQMREGTTGDRQGFLEQLNAIRHELLTVSNRMSQTAEGAHRMATAGEPVLGQDARAFQPLAERFESLRKICQNEREFADGVLEHYQSVVQTKMNIAMERVALIAYLLIPFTIATGLLGMQISAPDGTNVVALAVTVAATFIATWLTYRYTKRRGWW